MSLGENIYQLRRSKNMSQDDLAAALAVSRQSVSKWENDSAVPELEKLIKMAQIFDTSLDSLVGRESSAPPPPMPPEQENEPRIIYVEKPVFPTFSGLQVLGIALLIVALLLAIALYNGRFGGTEIIFMALPFVLCGILCLTSKHGLFYSGWVCAFGYWVYLFILARRWEEQHFLLLLGVVIIAAMYICSIQIHRKGILHIPFAVWLVGTLILTILAALLIVNTLPPIHITGSSLTSTPVESGP